MRPNTVLVEQIKKIKELELQKKMIEEQIEISKNILKDEMKTRKKDELSIEGWVLRNAKTITNTFDTKSFKEEFDELYARYCNPKESVRFYILKEGR